MWGYISRYKLSRSGEGEGGGRTCPSSFVVVISQVVFVLVLSCVVIRSIRIWISASPKSRSACHSGRPSIRPRACIPFSFFSASFAPPTTPLLLPSTNRTTQLESSHPPSRPKPVGALCDPPVPSRIYAWAVSQNKNLNTRDPSLTSNIRLASTVHLRSAVPPPHQSRTDQARTAHRASAAC